MAEASKTTRIKKVFDYIVQASLPFVKKKSLLFWHGRLRPLASVTRLGDFLHFGQPFKEANGNNYFTQIAHIVSQFL